MARASEQEHDWGPAYEMVITACRQRAVPWLVQFVDLCLCNDRHTPHLLSFLTLFYSRSVPLRGDLYRLGRS